MANKDLILREKLAIQRTVMANQTTFLAFIRTSMYFLVAGISLDSFIDVKHGHIYSYILSGVSVVILVIGIINYFIQNKRIKDSWIHVGDYKDEYGQS